RAAVRHASSTPDPDSLLVRHSSSGNPVEKRFWPSGMTTLDWRNGMRAICYRTYDVSKPELTATHKQWNRRAFRVTRFRNAARRRRLLAKRPNEPIAEMCGETLGLPPIWQNGRTKPTGKMLTFQ